MATSACSPRAGDVEIIVSLEHPLSNMELLMVPYDAVGILDSLERAVSVPKPVFPSLEAQFVDYEWETPPELADLFGEWAAARTKVNRLADSLQAIGREAQGYRDAYARFRTLYASLVRQESDLERSTRALSAEDRELAQQATAAADSLRAWQSMAFESYESLALSALAQQEPRTEVLGTTDEEGRWHGRLGSGNWWVLVRMNHPTNPFQEYFWSTPFRVDGIGSLRIPLSRRNVTLRWRQ